MKRNLVPLFLTLFYAFGAAGLTACDTKDVESASLHYALSEDESYYIVRGLSNKTRTTTLAVPGVYHQLSVKTVGSFSFSNCFALTEIILSYGVQTVETYAFSNCSLLTSVTLPATLCVVGNNAFYGCTSLASVYYGGTADEWAAIHIGSGNAALTDATRYDYSESAQAGCWRYVDGTPTVW